MALPSGQPHARCPATATGPLLPKPLLLPTLALGFLSQFEQQMCGAHAWRLNSALPPCMPHPFPASLLQSSELEDPAAVVAGIGKWVTGLRRLQLYGAKVRLRQLAGESASRVAAIINLCWALPLRTVRSSR